MIDSNQIDAPESSHTSRVHALAAGRWAGRPVFASAGEDRRVLLWDAATGRVTGPAFPEFTEAVTHVVFAGADRDVLVTSDAGGTVLRWEIRDGAPHAEPIHRASPPPSHRSRCSMCTPASASSCSLAEGKPTGLGAAVVDGRAVVGVGSGDGVRIFDLGTGELYAEVWVDEGKVHVADIAVLDGRLVAMTIAHQVAGHQPELPEVTVWDVAAGTPLRDPWLVSQEAGHFGRLASMDGELVVIMGAECTDYLYWDDEDDDDDEDGDDEDDDEDDEPYFDSPYQNEYFHEHVHDVELGVVATGDTRSVVWELFEQPEGGAIAPTPHGDVVLFTVNKKVAVVNRRRPSEDGDVKDFAYTGHDTYLSAVAATDVDGRTVIASGDWGGNVHLWGLDTPDRSANIKAP